MIRKKREKSVCVHGSSVRTVKVDLCLNYRYRQLLYSLGDNESKEECGRAHEV